MPPKNSRFDPPKRVKVWHPFEGVKVWSHPPGFQSRQGDIGCPWKIWMVGTFFLLFPFRAFRHIFFRGKMAMLVSGRVSPISGVSTWRIIPFDKWLITIPDAPCMQYLYAYIWLRCMVNVGKYASFMDPMGLNCFVLLSDCDFLKKGDLGPWFGRKGRWIGSRTSPSQEILPAFNVFKDLFLYQRNRIWSLSKWTSRRFILMFNLLLVPAPAFRKPPKSSGYKFPI